MASSHRSDRTGMPQLQNGQEEIFDVGDLKAREPFGQFRHWFEDALRVLGNRESHAMTVATATRQGVPSARVVLMREFDKRGFVFLTDYGSRKAKELEENPNCSLVFYWEALSRSVRIEGRAERASAEESEKAFSQISRPCQVKTYIGTQTSVVPSREDLHMMKEQVAPQFSDESKPVPRPDTWGCYRVVPSMFEFWVSHSDWMSERLRFRRAGSEEVLDQHHTIDMEDGWVLDRLLP